MVVFYEMIEDIGGQDYCRRNGYFDVVEFISDLIVVYKNIDKSQTARLAAERSAADPREAVKRIERFPAEVGYQAALSKLLPELKSDTFLGLSLCASQNSVRAFSHFEK